MYNLVVNTNHPKVLSLLEKSEETQTETVRQLADLAMLSQGMLKGVALDQFIERTIAQIS
jgi:molecular chaperone HtpG